ncbi:hypothetical protein GCM10023196_080170 [Actinoallomurus vinaceus]|uniref:Uncharacterized protein n=1 Tax=Actinoallomurus vinaceus TaxID=1080074 RepID=A0ABP8UMH8_9ACTN
MPRQIAAGLSDPSISLLEGRIRRLETEVALLAHAVQALTRELTERREEADDAASSRRDRAR